MNLMVRDKLKIIYRKRTEFSNNKTFWKSGCMIIFKIYKINELNAQRRQNSLMNTLYIESKGLKHSVFCIATTRQRVAKVSPLIPVSLKQRFSNLIRKRYNFRLYMKRIPRKNTINTTDIGIQFAFIWTFGVPIKWL